MQRIFSNPSDTILLFIAIAITVGIIAWLAFAKDTTSPQIDISEHESIEQNVEKDSAPSDTTVAGRSFSQNERDSSSNSEIQEEIFKIVEEQPSFPGCETIFDKMEKKKCTDERMLQFIYTNIKYPAEARENGIEGMVVVKFVVEKNGSVTNAEIARDIGSGCGREALRVVRLMPDWEPGKQKGRPVRVQFNLPVKFKLE